MSSTHVSTHSPRNVIPHLPYNNLCSTNCGLLPSGSEKKTEGTVLSDPLRQKTRSSHGARSQVTAPAEFLQNQQTWDRSPSAYLLQPKRSCTVASRYSLGRTLAPSEAAQIAPSEIEIVCAQREANLQKQANSIMQLLEKRVDLKSRQALAYEKMCQSRPTAVPAALETRIQSEKDLRTMSARDVFSLLSRVKDLDAYASFVDRWIAERGINDLRTLQSVIDQEVSNNQDLPHKFERKQSHASSLIYSIQEIETQKPNKKTKGCC